LHLDLSYLISLSSHELLSLSPTISLIFFFNDPAPTEIYTLSLHDALPISEGLLRGLQGGEPAHRLWQHLRLRAGRAVWRARHTADRKSTRLNSSHVAISYAVFCLKKKKKE